MENGLKFFNDYSINNEINSTKDSIRIDMGLDGDDAYYFLKEFEEKFKIDVLNKFDFSEYFHLEYELYHSRVLKSISCELKISDLLDLIKKTQA